MFHRLEKGNYGGIRKLPKELVLKQTTHRYEVNHLPLQRSHSQRLKMLPQTLFLHTLKVLNRILHSQSSQQGRSCESCSACSRETLVNHCAMPATRIQISNAPEERRIWFYEAQKMIYVCYLFFEEKLHPKKIEKLQMK